MTIRFEPHERLNSEAQHAESLIQEWRGQVEHARDRFLATQRSPLSDDSLITPRLTNETSFFELPETLLLAYERFRESSELGHVFQIANGMHDHIDAVVVNGPRDATLATKAMMTACCDPYHNELSRAARGSKPRMYFCGDRLDNDTLQSLLGRMDAGGYGDGPAEQRWLIILTDKSRRTQASAACFEQLFQSLNRSIASSVDATPHDYLVAIGSPASQANLPDTVFTRNRRLTVPEAVSEINATLSPQGLLPCAFLGLDCIQLLAGAAEINAHFRDAPVEENLVLKLLIACRLADDHDAYRPWLSSAVGALDGFATWHERVLGRASTRRRHAVVGLEVQNSRTDPLMASSWQQWSGEQTTTQLDALHDAFGEDDSVRRSFDQSRSLDSQEPENAPLAGTLVLPQIDTFHLGQLLQLLMLAAAVSARLFEEFSATDEVNFG